MKKYSAWKLLVGVLAIAAILCACQSTQNNTSATQETTNNAAASDAALTLCQSYDEDGYYLADAFYTDSTNANLTYFDFASKKQIFLCEQPGCTHDTESCRSYTMGIPQIYVINDALVLFEMASDETKPANIQLADKDGSNRRLLMEFPADCLVLDPVYHDGQNLYMMTQQTSKDTGDIMKKIIKVSLQNGEQTEIYTFAKEDYAASLEGAWGRNFIISHYRMDEQHNVYSDECLLNLDTGKMDEQALAVLDAGNEGAVVGDGVLYRVKYADQKIEIFDFETKETQTVDYAPIAASIEGTIEPNVGVSVMEPGLLLLEFMDFSGEETKFHYVVFNIENGEYHPFTLLKTYNKDVISRLAETEDSFLVLTDWISSVVDVDELGVETRQYEARYAMISKSDYENSIPNYISIASDIYPDAWNKSTE